MEQQNRIILWVVIGGVLSVVAVWGAVYFLTRTPTGVDTTALPVAVAQPTTSANTESKAIQPTTTAPEATTSPATTTQAQVTAAKFPIWKTIKLGTYKDVNALRSAFTGNFFISKHYVFDTKTERIIGSSTDLLDGDAFTMSTTETEVDLVNLSDADLGFANGAAIEEIYQRAQALGLALCPPEVAPQLRLQYGDQPNGELLLVGMNPFMVPDGMRVFHLENIDGDLMLQADGDPFEIWSGADRWVFVRPR